MLDLSGPEIPESPAGFGRVVSIPIQCRYSGLLLAKMAVAFRNMPFGFIQVSPQHLAVHERLPHFQPYRQASL